MLSIEECQRYLRKYDLSKEQVEKIRNILYCLSENVIASNLQKQIAKKKKDDEQSRK